MAKKQEFDFSTRFNAEIEIAIRNVIRNSLSKNESFNEKIQDAINENLERVSFSNEQLDEIIDQAKDDFINEVEYIIDKELKERAKQMAEHIIFKLIEQVDQTEIMKKYGLP